MNSKLHKFTYYFVTALIAGCVLIIFVIFPGINDDKPSMFGDMIYGKASKPYVYRVLLPATVRVLSAPIPQTLRNTISIKIEDSISLNKLFKKLKWEKELAVEYSFAMLIMFLSLWGFSIAVRHLFILFYNTSSWFADSVSVLALLGLPAMFQYTSFIYDFPLLLLYTLGLIFLYKQGWKKFLIIFLVGCINKETTILLTLVFYIFYKSGLNKELFNKLLVAQLATFILVKSLLYFVFKNNPGTFIEFHLIDHNLRLLTGYDLTLAATVLGLVLLVLYKWNEKPKFLKTSLWMLIPLVILTLLLGYLDELRDYYEVYPVVIIFIAHSFARILNVNFKLNIQYKFKNNPNLFAFYR
ncbi:MAG: hypothetical protein IH852_12790 [Bacteroidetes bacterium]|nr:hypothetical protein [Bacteroidota bacterium]